MNKRALFVVLGIVLLVLGGVWLLQGVGLVGGSFMTGDSLWVVIGGVVALAGAGLLVGTATNRGSGGGEAESGD